MGTNHTTTTPSACPKSDAITIPAPERFGDSYSFGRELTAVLDDAEGASKLLFSLAELLEGNPPLARLAMLAQFQAARTADRIGEMLGVEVDAC